MRVRRTVVAVVCALALVGCAPNVVPDASSTSSSTPSAPSFATSPTATPTPTPIDGLPDDHAISAANGHTAAQTWAFITTSSGNPVAVRINGLWQGTAGELAGRNYTQPSGDVSVDVGTAVPFFLSWSYVVLGGTDKVPPDAIVLPSSTGNLYNVTSPFSDNDCPDYAPGDGQGVGFLVTHCAVSMSTDGATPIGLAFNDPSADQQYWFMDAPAPTDKPA